MAYRASPRTAAPDRPRPWSADHLQRARLVAEVERDALKPCGLMLPAVTTISGPSAQLNLFSFITPIDLNRLVGASVLKSHCGAHYALSAKKIRWRRTMLLCLSRGLLGSFCGAGRFPSRGSPWRAPSDRGQDLRRVSTGFLASWSSLKRSLIATGSSHSLNLKKRAFDWSNWGASLRSRGGEVVDPGARSRLRRLRDASFFNVLR